MPRVCTICGHKKRHEIEKALLSGKTLRGIARQWGVSKDAAARHKAHLPATLVKAREAKEVARADSLLDQMKSLTEEARGILDRVKTTEPKTALMAIREIRGNVELLAKLVGEMKSDVTVKVQTNVALAAVEEDGDRLAAILGVLMQSRAVPLPGPSPDPGASIDTADEGQLVEASEAAADELDQAPESTREQLWRKAMAAGGQYRWPQLRLRDDRLIPAGEPEWRHFLAEADENTLELVLEAIPR